MLTLEVKKKRTYYVVVDSLALSREDEVREASGCRSNSKSEDVLVDLLTDLRQRHSVQPDAERTRS